MRYLRRVIRITAEDSPNVKHALAQRAAGVEPDGADIVPNVLSWQEYQHRLLTWDERRKSIGLWGQFWKGGESYLFPAEWLNACAEAHRAIMGKKRTALGVGVDTAEGGDSTSLAAVDAQGLIALKSLKTRDTNVIPGMVIGFCAEVGLADPRKCLFDRGGGGQQHVDRLRAAGFNAQSVAFGEAPSLEPKRSMRLYEEKVEVREDRYVYLNRRAEMYHQLSLKQGFAIDPAHAELVRQLSLIPKAVRVPGTDREWSIWDEEGRIRMLPKRRTSANGGLCLEDIVGCSPDEADALVLAVHAMEKKVAPTVAGSGFGG